MADSGAHRVAAELPDDLGHRLRADQVVHDRAVGVAGVGGEATQRRRRDDGGGEGTGEGLSPVVDEKHAVGVTVEGEADVGV